MKKFLVAAALVASVSSQAFAATLDSATANITATQAAVDDVTLSSTTGTLTGFSTNGRVVAGDYDTSIDATITTNSTVARNITTAVSSTGTSASGTANFLTIDGAAAAATTANAISISSVKIAGAAVPATLTNGAVTGDLQLATNVGTGVLATGNYKGTVTITLAD